MAGMDDPSAFASAMGNGQSMPVGMGGEAAPQEQIQAPYLGLGDIEASRREHPHQKLLRWSDLQKTPNIAEELDDELLNAIGQRCNREYNIDLGTGSEWRDLSQNAMDLAMQVAKSKQFPWPGASNIVFPLMTTAAVQFNARAYPAIIQGRNVVKGIVGGQDNGIPQVGPDGQPMMQMTPQGPQPVWVQPPGGKRSRALRIGEHMSWQLLEEMKEWEEETDKLLLILPIIGCAFRKTYFNAALSCNASVLVMAKHVVVNYGARSLERAPRVTEDIELYPIEIEESIRGGLFIDQTYQAPSDSSGDDDAPREFREQHRLLDLDEDGYAEPYVVTYEAHSHKIARIVARYDSDGVHVNRKGEVAKIDAIQYYTKYDFLRNPEGGFYGVGFGQLLGPINAAVNTSLNQLFDAGTLQNTGGGWIGRGVSMQSGSLKFKLGEWKVVNAPGQSIRDNVVPHQHAGPSTQLYQLLVFLVEAGKEVASVKDSLTGDVAAATMQPTTLMALIEQGLKVFTAIYKRVHLSAKQEYDKLYDLNRKYLPYQARYQAGDEWKTVTQEDYARGAGVKPVSDPAMVSDMQRAAKAQFLMGFANDPLFNPIEIRQRILDAGQIEDTDKLLLKQPPQPPPNPLLIAKAAEMEMKGHELEAKIASMKATQIKDLSAAVLNLANADATVGDQHLGWIEQHIDLLRAQMEAITLPADKPGQGGAPGGAGLPPAGPRPGLPPSGPMPGMGSQLPGDGSMEPPFPGARQSVTGNWYPGHPATPSNVGG